MLLVWQNVDGHPCALTFDLTLLRAAALRVGSGADPCAQLIWCMVNQGIERGVLVHGVVT